MPSHNSNNDNKNINQINQNFYSNNQNGFYGNYYIAPYCAADGASIYLGVYYDQQCMNQVEDISVYGDNNHGATLPYSSDKKSLVIHNDCLACVDSQNDNNNNNNNSSNNNGNQNYGITELCKGVYQEAAKCETNNMGLPYSDTSGCTFVNEVISRMENENSMMNTASYSSNAKKVSSGGA
jgi:hypothetical protein